MRRVIPPLLVAGIVAVALLVAQTMPDAPFELTATTAHVGGAPDSVRIEILRWSTDDEREKLMLAWELKAVPSVGGGAGRGAGKLGKGGAKGAATAGRGRGAPGGRAGSGGSTTSGPTPEGALASALQESATAGYLWSAESVGYALRYAGRSVNPDGSQRIILLTDRRLGAVNQLWNPTFQGTPNSYEFSVIELRLNAKGEGEGKASVAGKVAADPAAKIVTVEDYGTLPVVFQDVRPRTARPATKR